MKKSITIIALILVMLPVFCVTAYADTSAPSLTINISGITSALGGGGGGDVEVIDLSWYTPYKQTVDNLISGFLWLGYIWHLFKIAPGLLGSVGLSVDRADDIDNGSKGRRK